LRIEEIKIKGEGTLKLEVRSTHRGPLFDFDNLSFGAGVLFGGKIPKIEDPPMYSMKWGNMEPGEDVPRMLRWFYELESVPEAMEAFNELGENGFRVMPINMVMADNKGNIGFQLGTAHPIRKSKVPYIGCRVLDGETTEFDWEPGLLPIKYLPRSLNPSRGFAMTANNRHSPDNVKYDYGATIMSTGRAHRIDELLRG